MYDLAKIRKDFPMLNNKTMQGKPLVFLDNASTTFKPQCVIDEMNYYYTEINSNSHRGDYDLCYQVDVEVNKTRELVAKFINSEINEVIFTSGDTESINLVAYSYALSHLSKGDKILISLTEHASNVLPWYRICKLTGASICFADIEGGRVTPETVRKAFKENKNIKIAAFAHVGNVLGYEIEAKEIAKICHDNGAVILLDGAQSVPHMKTDFKDLNVDFLSFSAHKMCGPTGVGCLIGKYQLLHDMEVFHTGGGMNEKFFPNGEMITYDTPNKFEAGTLNLAGIIGFGEAIKYLMNIGLDNIHKHDEELFDYALSKLEKCNHIEIYNKDSRNGIIAFNVKGVFAQDEATLLNSKGIAVRSGQHCAKMIDTVINNIATVRASTYLYTSKEDIDVLIENLINGGDILDAYFN